MVARHGWHRHRAHDHDHRHADRRPILQASLAELMPRLYALKTPKDLRWHIDVDPGEL